MLCKRDFSVVARQSASKSLVTTHYSKFKITEGSNRYIHQITRMLIGSFYRKYVKAMPADEVPPEILANPKFNPYFVGARGAADGSHFNSWVQEDATTRYRNRKGFISQNILAVCDWKLRFVYLLSGWEGSAADSRIFEYARRTDLALPDGCYFLADAGFPLCDMLLTPYRGVRYHLNEWGRGSQKYVHFVYFF